MALLLPWSFLNMGSTILVERQVISINGMLIKQTV